MLILLMIENIVIVAINNTFSKICTAALPTINIFCYRIYKTYIL